ncbi:MAG: hypothetical protein QOJ80_5712 [Mycobacterium sp.]|nr:hypothetical protein [Mycobacterium sp.]
MKRTMRRRLAVTVAIFGAVVTHAVGCSAQQPNSQTAEPTSSAVPFAPATAVQFDPQWMGLVQNQPQGWKELNRRITSDFQQFSLRPTDEGENRFGCNGCAPWTVDLTAYAPGKFDPMEARTGQPVSVNADDDGFLAEDAAKHAATLAWPYADNAWATVRGTTSATTEVDRMVELARALQPNERTPIRLPLSMPNVPAFMPLAELNVDTSPLEDDDLDYGTTLTFAPCGLAVNGGVGDCAQVAASMDVHIWPADGYYGHFREQTAVPMNIGGRDGLFDDDLDGAGDHAAVQVQPGMLVVFDSGLGRPHYAGSPSEPPTGLKDVLSRVGWAPDPGNEATWPAVSDWAK